MQPPHRGDYFRADYDPHFDRYSHHKHAWLSTFDCFDGEMPEICDWLDTLREAIQQRLPQIRLGCLKSGGWPGVDIDVLDAGKSWLRGNVTLESELHSESLLLCGVNVADERRLLREFNAAAGRKPRAREEDSVVRPFRLKERPLCVSVWYTDRSHSMANISVELALRTLAAAYFRFKMVA